MLIFSPISFLEYRASIRASSFIHGIIMFTKKQDHQHRVVICVHTSKRSREKCNPLRRFLSSSFSTHCMESCLLSIFPVCCCCPKKKYIFLLSLRAPIFSLCPFSLFKPISSWREGESHKAISSLANLCHTCCE